MSACHAAGLFAPSMAYVTGRAGDAFDKTGNTLLGLG
jgi:hypothetical protein